MRPRLLDLFCGAGGAAMGYHRAGFDVVGVDIAPQPHYPFEFHQADALTFPLEGFHAIHASPPCQAYTSLRALRGDRHHPDLVALVRERLVDADTHWVIENVPGAPIRPDVILCGSQFGLGVWRHRWFEFAQPPAHLVSPCRHDYQPIGVYGQTGTSRRGHKGVLADWVTAMGIDWMNSRELSQAIPPAYTEYIGAQLLAHIEAAA